MAKLILALMLSGAAAFVAPSAARAELVARPAMSEEDLKAKIMNAGPAEFNKIGGIEIEEMVMPEGISFEAPIPAKVMGRWDGEYVLTVSDGEITAGGTSVDVTVTPDAMTIEDFYAGFEGAPEWITVSPNIGKLERKGGEATILTVSANPPKGTEFEEDLGLVCVLPDDIDKAYKIAVKVGANVVTKEFDAGSDEELD